MNEYILKQKYLRKKEDGTYETVDEFYDRVSLGVAGDDEEFRCLIRELLSEQKVIFGGRVLAAACAEQNTHQNALTMLNCFALGIEDSLTGILETLRKTTLVLASGGGSGLALSKIRPRGSRASHRDGLASGSVSFMSMFDTMAQTIVQGGARRGALMGILEVWHPDIEEFIEAKACEGSLGCFNISVGVDSSFLKAVHDDSEWDLTFPKGEKVYKTIKARELFRKICERAWLNGDPGLLFLENVDADNATPWLGPLEITNPCGEANLYSGEACCLGSINLVKFLLLNRQGINWAELGFTVRVMVNALDMILDKTYYPLENEGNSYFRDMTLRTRKIGLGVVGWHDILIYMGINYDSQQALDLADSLFGFIEEEALEASLELAEVSGPYPAWQEPAPKVRNASRLSIAPTGSIAMVLEASHSIEPNFNFAYTKKLFAAAGEEKEVCTVIKPLEVLAAENDYWRQEKEWKDALEQKDISKLERIIPSDIRRLVRGATELSPEAHIKTLETVQRHVDQGVSKTINLPNSTTVEEIEEIVLNASKTCIKGITVYREGSREVEVLTKGFKSADSQLKDLESLVSESFMEQSSILQIEDLTKVKRPKVRSATIYEVATKHGNLHAAVSKYDNRLYEMFLSLSRAGTDIAPLAEALGRLVTLLFKKGVSTTEIKSQLEGVGGSTSIAGMKSLPDGVAAILSMIEGEETPKVETFTLEGQESLARRTGDLCSSCHRFSVVKLGNCRQCIYCGQSTCG